MFAPVRASATTPTGVVALARRVPNRICHVNRIVGAFVPAAVKTCEAILTAEVVGVRSSYAAPFAHATQQLIWMSPVVRQWPRRRRAAPPRRSRPVPPMR